MKKILLFSAIIITSVLSATFAVIIERGYEQQELPINGNISNDQNLVPKYASMVSSPAINTDFTLAAEKSIHAVVHVRTKSTRQSHSQEDLLLEYFYGYRPQNPQPVQGSGSGVLINSKGYIVTNNHVISNSDEIEVTLNDKRSFKAKLIGTDPTTDIAVIKIDSKDPLPYLQYGNSDALKVGEWVLAVGNPFNLTSTVTAGVVSAKARNIGIIAERNNTMAIESFIQTDAAVNPGNSGGALVNTNGELVGINSAIASPTGSFSGYSFAVPVSIAKKVVADLMEYGQVQRAFLGVTIRDINDELAKKENLKVLEGALVIGVSDQSGALEAGIKEKDIITAINGNKVNSVSELQDQVTRYRPGDQIKVQVIRNEKNEEYQVTLRNSLGNTEIVKGIDTDALGGTFEEVDAQLKRKLNIRYGIQVTEVGEGKLKKANIRNGFIIVQINGQAIKSTNDIISSIKNNDGVLFITGIYPNGKMAYYAIDVNE